MGTFFDIYIEQFHQDILTLNDTMEEAIQEAIGALNENDKAQLKLELEAISSDPSIRFMDLWNSSRSPFRLRDERDARDILAEILARL